MLLFKWQCVNNCNQMREVWKLCIIRPPSSNLACFFFCFFSLREHIFMHLSDYVDETLTSCLLKVGYKHVPFIKIINKKNPENYSHDLIRSNCYSLFGLEGSIAFSKCIKSNNGCALIEMVWNMLYIILPAVQLVPDFCVLVRNLNECIDIIQ